VGLGFLANKIVEFKQTCLSFMQLFLPGDCLNT